MPNLRWRRGRGVGVVAGFGQLALNLADVQGVMRTCMISCSSQFSNWPALMSGEAQLFTRDVLGSCASVDVVVGVFGKSNLHGAVAMVALQEVV